MMMTADTTSAIKTSTRTTMSREVMPAPRGRRRCGRGHPRRGPDRPGAHRSARRRPPLARSGSACRPSGVGWRGSRRCPAWTAASADCGGSGRARPPGISSLPPDARGTRGIDLPVDLLDPPVLLQWQGQGDLQDGLVAAVLPQALDQLARGRGGGAGRLRQVAGAGLLGLGQGQLLALEGQLGHRVSALARSEASTGVSAMSISASKSMSVRSMMTLSPGVVKTLIVPNSRTSISYVTFIIGAPL